MQDAYSTHQDWIRLSFRVCALLWEMVGAIRFFRSVNIPKSVRNVAELGKRALSSQWSPSQRYRTNRRVGSRKWDMLQKQAMQLRIDGVYHRDSTGTEPTVLKEYIYDTMFASGEVEVESHGSPKFTEALVEALRLQWAYGFPYTPKGFPLLTHAFHAYPAGMQPAAARHLLQTVLPGGPVFDPFVGGGTVVLEAAREGRSGVGADISPLALFVSRGRCWMASEGDLERLRQAARAIAETASAGLDGASSRRVSGGDWEVVKIAISGYLSAKGVARGESLEHALWFVFSVARARAAKARHRRNIVADRYFESVCIEYASAVGELTREASAAAAPLRPFAPLIINRDARQPFGSRLRSPRHGESAEETQAGGNRAKNGHSKGTAVSAEESAGMTPTRCWQECEEFPIRQEGVLDSKGHGEGEAGDLIFDVVLTSPPYPGVYDYLGEARYSRSQLGTLLRPTLLRDTAEGLGFKAVVENDDVNVVEEEATLGIVPSTEADSSSRATSVFVDSPVPSGRDWPSAWTNGEIGAKSDARRRRRDAALSCSDGKSALAGACSLKATDQEPGVDPREELSSKWSKDQREWLMATAGILRPGGGRMAVMLGDGDDLDTRSSLIREIEALALTDREGALGVIGWATMRATRGARRSMRTEHLILLEKY